jgi:PAS domain S-box-containing protein
MIYMTLKSVIGFATIKSGMQSLFELLFQHIQEAVVIRTLSGEIVGWNRSAERIYGYTEEEALQLRFEALVPERSRNDLTAPAEKALMGEATERLETTRQKKDGNLVRVFIVLIPAKDEQGRISHLVELADPFPGREQAILSLAHNLRNALSSITALCYLLKHNFDAKYIDRLNRHVVFCDSIVNNLLEYAGVRRSQRTRVNLHVLSRDVISMLHLPQGIEVEVAGEPEVNANVDSSQMEQVLINLLQNSIDALEGKPGKILIRIRDEAPYARLDVSDNGPGIALADPEQVFEPLVTTKIDGIGLGLAACKQMVEANQGKIGVESQQGIGTTFSVILPKG